VPRLAAVLRRPADGTAKDWAREHAAEALGMLGPAAKAAVPDLRRLLDGDDDALAEAAARALERIGK
jgi:HEAT repeat protein